MKTPLFTGVCTALVTPFDESGVNFSMLRRLIERQIAAGIPAIVVAGTTGESPTLSREEKLALFAQSVRIADGRCKILAGTGGNYTEAAVRLSRDAEETGVDGLLCVTPYYNKCTQEGLYRHYSSILDAVSLPVLLYNVPSRTNVSLSPETCARLAAHPNAAGLKEADPDVARLFRLRALCGGGFPVYSGNDDRIVPFCAAGAKGVVSVWSNVEPVQARRLCACCAAGDYEQAARLQTEAQPLIDALFAQVNPIPVKAAMKLLGYDCGEPRLPLTPCPAALEKTLQNLTVGADHSII